MWGVVSALGMIAGIEDMGLRKRFQSFDDQNIVRFVLQVGIPILPAN